MLKLEPISVDGEPTNNLTSLDSSLGVDSSFYSLSLIFLRLAYLVVTEGEKGVSLAFFIEGSSIRLTCLQIDEGGSIGLFKLGILNDLLVFLTFKAA